jgi:hypothetical protein
LNVRGYASGSAPGVAASASRFVIAISSSGLSGLSDVNSISAPFGAFIRTRVPDEREENA